MANFREGRRIYPAKVEFEVRRISGRDDRSVVEGVGSHDGGPAYHGVSILEFRGDKVAYETIYGGAAWEAPQWRARWRAGREPMVLHPDGGNRTPATE